MSKIRIFFTVSYQFLKQLGYHDCAAQQNIVRYSDAESDENVCFKKVIVFAVMVYCSHGKCYVDMICMKEIEAKINRQESRIC